MIKYHFVRSSVSAERYRFVQSNKITSKWRRLRLSTGIYKSVDNRRTDTLTNTCEFVCLYSPLIPSKLRCDYASLIQTFLNIDLNTQNEIEIQMV